MDIQENIPLAPHTTLGIGGPARYFAHIAHEDDLLHAIHFARENSLPIFTLGGGSNLLVSDAGFPGLVLHLALTGDTTSTLLGTTALYQVPAGREWDAFVLEICRRGLTGIECMAGIPGSVGGTPVQNVGAYGQEVSQSIRFVRVLDLETLNFLDISAPDCHFAYRSSIFNTSDRNRFIVTRVVFGFDTTALPLPTYAELARQFDNKPRPTPLEIYAAVRQIRDRKGMLLDPAHPHPDSRSAGSFFKNPIVPTSALAKIAADLSIPISGIPNWPTSTGELKLPAAWLIEQAGFAKGFTLGEVAISTRHTLALVNRTGTATCADLLALRDLIVTTVDARFNIALEQEPVYLR